MNQHRRIFQNLTCSSSLTWQPVGMIPTPTAFIIVWAWTSRKYASTIKGLKKKKVCKRVSYTKYHYSI